MSITEVARSGLSRVLAGICVLLITLLVVLIVVAVIARKSGHSLYWYDEIASLMLAWLSYYGAALAALHRAHLGFGNVLVAKCPVRLRAAFFLISEALILGFMLLLAWSGWRVLMVLEGDTLISLPWIPLQFAQSVIPLGAVAFVLAEVLSLHKSWHETVTAPAAETARETGL